MLVAIRDIGKYLRENNGVTEINIIRSLVNKIEGDSIKEIFFINIKDNGEIETQSEEFYSDITTKALFYQAGNGALGGAMRADFYKDGLEEIEKFNKKIKTTLSYCEVEKYYDEVKELIYKKIKEQNKNFIVVILINGKYPYEMFKDKFLEKMYSTMFKGIEGECVCHLCGHKGKVYNTTTYKFYTNDKEVYSSIDGRDKFGITMCEGCLNDLLIGKRYVEDKLTTYWMDRNVMFLPHNFNEVTDGVYDSSVLTEKEKKKFLDNLYSDEEFVLESLGKGNTETDIIFFDKDGNKTFYIQHSIKSMMPSRFGELAILLKKYTIKLFNVIHYSTAVKAGLKGVETTQKEKLRCIDAIFSGRKIDRKLFFSRVMLVYRFEYIHNTEKSKFIINNIGKIYNFLVDCGCMEGRYNIMSKYEGYEELFDDNKSYFNTNEKKAWFLMGVAYSNINYKMRKSNADSDGKLADRSSLDKNFFFARKFDFRDFVYFSNLLSDKIIKYKISSSWIKGILTESKELMAKPTGKLSTDEAKYIFFWGMDSYFEKKDQADAMNEKIDNDLEGVE